MKYEFRSLLARHDNILFIPQAKEPARGKRGKLRNSIRKIKIKGRERCEGDDDEKHKARYMWKESARGK